MSYPKNFYYHWDQQDLILEFTLPTGSYATMLLAELFRDIDTQTFEHSFQIPL
ncbi:MAG: tRNA pseudouridine(13) synthase TruD [bacterium]|nr:tRNA pseudouridine(13) synthase TruD [bacterium]